MAPPLLPWQQQGCQATAAPAAAGGAAEPGPLLTPPLRPPSGVLPSPASPASPAPSPPGPGPPVTSHRHRLTLLSWARPPAPCRPPGRAPGPQALLGQTPHLPNGDSQTRAQSWAEQGGGRCCNRPGGAEETDVARAWASPLLRTPCRLSCDPSPGEGAPRAQVSWEPESAPPEGGSRGDSGS